MKCKLCKKKLNKEEKDYCFNCKRFLKWKYKKEFDKRLEHENGK